MREFDVADIRDRQLLPHGVTSLALAVAGLGPHA